MLTKEWFKRRRLNQWRINKFSELGFLRLKDFRINFKIIKSFNRNNHSSDNPSLVQAKTLEPVEAKTLEQVEARTLEQVELMALSEITSLS
ncbi:hypothetical protein [Arcicella aurantiaca]|uniref:hypothetical protein n=1 Tax=Arcicella aurantiaca TaxID=591202 RepID=UPI000D6DBFDD|nr:hypothetical protein [Arcicella aurantiaca]